MGAFHLDTPTHCACSTMSDIVKHEHAGRLTSTNTGAISGTPCDPGFPERELFYTFMYVHAVPPHSM